VMIEKGQRRILDASSMGKIFYGPKTGRQLLNIVILTIK
jgi:hypothetical protein